MKSYLGFVSYSSEDRELVIAIHRKLETLTLPKNIALPEGELWKKRALRPIFLDRRNIRFGSEEYKQHILAALEETEWLLVFCSPRSALSVPVREEIEYFLATHPKGWERVVPVILDGEPWESDEAARHSLPQPLFEQWQRIRDWPMPSDKGILASPRKYEMALSNMAEQTLSNNWGATSQGKQWYDHILKFFDDTLKKPRNVLAHGYAVQIAAYILRVPPGALHNALQEEEKKRFRVRVALGFAALLAMFGLVQWAMYERQMAGTQTANYQYNNARRALEQGESAAALAYLASSLKNRPLPEVRHQVQRLLLQESWLVPMPPAQNTCLLKDRSAMDDFFYTRATTKFFSKATADYDDLAQQVAVLPNGDSVEWSLPGTLNVRRQDHSLQNIHTAAPDKGIIPLGLLRGSSAYAFAEVSLNMGKEGLNAVTRVTVLQTTDWSQESSITITGWLRGLCVSPMSDRIFAAYADSPDKKAWLAAFAPGNEALLWRTSIPIQSNSLRVSPNGASLLLTMPNGTESFSNVALVLFDAHSGQQRQGKRELLPLTHVEFSPDGQRLAVLDMQNTLRLLDVRDLSREVTQPLRVAQRPAMLCFSADGRYVTLMRKGKVQWYGIQIAQPLAEHVSVRDLGAVPSVHALPGEEALLVVQHGLGGNSMDIRDYRGAQRSNALPLKGQHVASVLSGDGRFLAMVGEENAKKIVVCSIEKQQNPEQPFVLRQHAELDASSAVDHLIFQPGGSLLLATSRASFSPGTIHLFDVQKPAAPPRQLRMEHILADARFSADGKHFLTQSNAAVQAWDSADLQRMPGPWDAAAQVDRILFNPLGKGIVVATWQHLQYYDASKQLWTLPLPSRCTHMAFSPDGKFLAAVYNRREVQVISCATGALTAPPVLTEYPVTALRFAQHGKDNALLISTRSSTVQQWEPGELLLYFLDQQLLAWKPQPLASYILDFERSSAGEVLPWNREGFFRIPALALLGEEEPMAADIAETLGGWQLDEKGRLQPAQHTLLQPAEQLALSPGWRTCLQWLQSPVGKRSNTPGGQRPLQSVLDGHSAQDTLQALQEVLRTDPAHAHALSRMSFIGAMRLSEEEIRKPYLAAGGQGEDAAAAAVDAWHATLRNAGTARLYDMPPVLQHADFWSQRALALHPEAAACLTARATFLRHTRRYAEAQTLVHAGLQQHPDHEDLLQEQALLAASSGNMSSQEQSLRARITALRQQKPLNGDDLIRANVSLFALRVRQGALLDEKALAQHMQDIVRAFSQNPVSTLSTRRTENYLFDQLYELRQWPLALAPGQQLIHTILSAASSGAIPAFDKNALPHWRRLEALYALLRTDPQTSLHLLANTKTKEGLPLPSFLLLPGLAREMLGQDGQQALQEGVDQILAAGQPSFTLDALAVIYALQAREVPFSPAMAKAKSMLEAKAQTALQRGIVRIGAVAPGGAGEKAGLAPGDSIISYDGIPMASASAFLGERMMQKMGETKTVAVQRRDQLLSIPLPAGMLQIELADEL